LSSTVFKKNKNFSIGVEKTFSRYYINHELLFICCKKLHSGKPPPSAECRCAVNNFNVPVLRDPGHCLF